MKEQESEMKTASKPIHERQHLDTDEGTGMGVIWDIQRFRRILEEEEAKVAASESKT